MLIEFILQLIFIVFSIELVEGVSFGLVLASCLLVYLFIKFIVKVGGDNDD